MISTMKHSPSCILLLLLILTTHFFIPSVLSERCNPADKRALLQIKKEFGNPTKLSSWDPTTDCCNRTWVGVACGSDKINYHVNMLSLYKLNLPKPVPIPSSIFTNLPFLTFLYLSRMPNLVGTIPPSISNTKLEYLQLIHTSISGEIPNTLSHIKTLVNLDFSYNKLTGPLPATLSSLPNLTEISFDGNQLSGTIPESYGSFQKSFYSMTLSRNRLSGKIPASLAKLNLAFVDLSRNALEGDASMFFGSEKQTQRIMLAMNSFAFDIGKVGLSKDLDSVDLRNNRIYGTLPEGLANLIYLSKLDLRNNKIYGTLPKGMTKLTYLDVFNVSNNNLCGQIPQGGKLQSFDESCYAHNKCLCASPLLACKTLSMSVSP